MRARKDGGAEGFLVVFNYVDPDNYCWLNIGGWGNTQNAIEQVVNGSKSQLVTAAGKVETGRWYDSEQRLSWGFDVENGEATISTPGFWDSNARDNCKGDIVVPSRIGPDGPGGKTTYPVRDMAPGLFRNCTKVTSVTLPDGIMRIAPNAFYFDRNSTITNISVGAMMHA